MLADVPLLDPSDDVYQLADKLVKRLPLPVKTAADSLHIAIATVHGMDYLLTWNCTHIANAALRTGIEKVCREAGYETPVICTPERLWKDCPMSTDIIVAEVRQARDTLARHFSYDLRAIIEDARARQAAGPRKTVSFPAKAVGRSTPVELSSQEMRSTEAPG